MKRKITKQIRMREIEERLRLLHAENETLRKYQVEEVAKFVDHQALRNSESFRQGLIHAVLRFAKIGSIITDCPPGGCFNHEEIVALAKIGVVEANRLLES